MYYVKAKISGKWWSSSVASDVGVTKGKVYTFPYIVFDDMLCFYNLNNDKEYFKDEFEFITKGEYLALTPFNFSEEHLNIIEELVKTKDESNTLIALEMYKTLMNNKEVTV